MKQQVKYVRKDDDFIVVGFSAFVEAIDHPYFGANHVRTSTVQSYDETTGVFETLNTIYTPKEK